MIGTLCSPDTGIRLGQLCQPVAPVSGTMASEAGSAGSPGGGVLEGLLQGQDRSVESDTRRLRQGSVYSSL